MWASMMDPPVSLMESIPVALAMVPRDVAVAGDVCRSAHRYRCRQN